MTDRNDCEGAFRISRRSFLKASAILSFAALPELALGATPSQTRVVVVLLRGGMDGLFAMPPVGDKALRSLRRNINPDDLQKLDGYFALHPALANIADMYRNGQALLVHGISIPYVGRSHFEGQDVMETGIMTPYASPSGWLGRALDTVANPSVTMTLPVPLVLRGKYRADTEYPSWLKSLSTPLYDKLLPLWATDDDLADYALQIDQQKKKLTRAPQMWVGDTNTLNDLARQAGERLKLADGPRVAVLDHVGFDSHSNQPGFHADRLREVDEALGVLRDSLGEVWNETLVVTVTEFGRTAAENGSWGTDHGWGTAVFVLGGKLKKSGIVADWPGLKKSQLYEGRDLLATLDARDLYGAIVSSAFQIEPELVTRTIIEHKPSELYADYL